MNTLKPLPCPWCGDPDPKPVRGETYRWMVVKCGCGAQGPEIKARLSGESPQDVNAKAEAEAIEAWNRRTAAIDALGVKP